MGITYVEGIVRGPNGHSEAVQFLVDSGATYSLLPESVWKSLGLSPKRKMSFTLADGRKVERGISECHFALCGEEGHSPVILGDPGDDEPILGVVTLETLALLFDPFQRALRPMAMRLG